MIHDPKKLEACARAMHEVVRAYRLVRHDDAVAQCLDDAWADSPWNDLPEDRQAASLQYVERVLDGEPASQFILGTVRCMAASLWMSVTYPETPALPAWGDFLGVPARSRVTVDYSKDSFCNRWTNLGNVVDD